MTKSGKRMNTDEVLLLLRKIAWNFVQRCPGLEFDDMFSEACVAYLHCVHRYDPSRGNMSTFLWHSVTNHLNTLLSKSSFYMENSSELPESIQDPNTGPEEAVLARERWTEWWNMLTPEARVIVELTFSKADSAPTDKPKLFRGVLVKALRSRGWSWTRIWKGLREVKLAVARL